MVVATLEDVTMEVTCGRDINVVAVEENTIGILPVSKMRVVSSGNISSLMDCKD